MFQKSHGVRTFAGWIFSVALGHAGNAGHDQAPEVPAVPYPWAVEPWLEVAGAVGEGTLNPRLPFSSPVTDHVSGYRLSGGLSWAGGFSVESRYESVENSAGDSTDQFRVVVDYRYEIGSGFTVLAGAGYGDLKIRTAADYFQMDADAVLLNAGLEYARGGFFGSVVYTQAFAKSASAEILGDELSLEAEDVGYLEGSLGYHFGHGFSAVVSLESQVFGNTVVERDWMATAGLRYRF